MTVHYPSLTRSILRVYRASSEETRVAGTAWYDEAFTICERLAWRHGTSVTAAVVAVAHLSPRTTWARNVEVAELLLAGEPKPPWFLTRSWDIAERSLRSANPLETFGPRADKTRSFALAILGDTRSVTVDSWAARVAGVDPGIVRTRGGYAVVANAYRSAGRCAGVPARELQAITWCHVRGSAA